MGIFSSITMYRTDGGQVMALSDMTTSHLLNAINHHRTQINTVISVQETIDVSKAGKDRLERRLESLSITVTALSCELVKRDPIEDPEVVGDDLEVHVSFLDHGAPY